MSLLTGIFLGALTALVAVNVVLLGCNMYTKRHQGYVVMQSLYIALLLILVVLGVAFLR